MRKARLALGFASVLLITTVAAGLVATTAAITIQLSEGDACETGPTHKSTAPPANVTALAGTVTNCTAEGDDPDTATYDSVTWTAVRDRLAVESKTDQPSIT